MLLVGHFKNEVGGAAGAIPDHQYRDLLGGQAALPGLAAPLARRAVKSLALAFLGAQKVSFVSLGNARKHSTLQTFRRRKEAVAPAMGGAYGNVQAFGNLAQDQPFAQGDDVIEPLSRAGAARPAGFQVKAQNVLPQPRQR